MVATVRYPDGFIFISRSCTILLPYFFYMYAQRRYVDGEEVEDYAEALACCAT